MENIGVILAAGKGTRMKSLVNSKAKVCFKIFDKAMIEYVYDALSQAKVNNIVTIVGHSSDEVIELLNTRCDFALQKEQKGTGHALMQTIPYLKKDTNTVIVCGDTPLLSTSTIEKLIETHVKEENVATILEAEVENPFGYGRLIKDKYGNLVKIVEEKDANEKEKKIKFINTGVYVIQTNFLIDYLKLLKPKNAQNEYYLTDIFKLFVDDSLKVRSCLLEDKVEFLGVNDRVQLALATKYMQRRINEKHMLNGISIVDPDTTYIGSDVVIGNDTTIYPNTFLYGHSIVGTNCNIGPNSYIVDSIIDNDVSTKNSVIENQTLRKTN